MLNFRNVEQQDDTRSDSPIANWFYNLFNFLNVEHPDATRPLPLPENWTRNFSHTGRIYYTNMSTGHSQWDFPYPEEEEIRQQYDVVADEVFHIQAERQARNERAQAERQALLEAERQARLEAEQENRENLLENLALISNNFNEYNMDVLSLLRRMIIQDNEQPIERSTITMYIMNLNSLISILRDRNVHSDLKHLCENIFEEMYEKLAKEKQNIDFGYTSHNETDDRFLIVELNRLNSIYNRFMYTINNGTHTSY